MNFDEPSTGSKFETIADEVQEDLQESPLVIIYLAEDIRLTLVEFQEKRDILLFSLERHDIESFYDNIKHVEIFISQMESRLLQVREVKEVIYHVVDHVCRIYGILDVQIHLLLEFFQLITASEMKLTNSETSPAVLAHLRPALILNVVNLQILWLLQMLNLLFIILTKRFWICV